MLKKIFLILLIISIPAAVFGKTAEMKVQIIHSEKTLLVNNVVIEGDWNFEYKVSNSSITSGDLNEGPMIGYISMLIEGKIIMPNFNPVLNDILRKSSFFNADYIVKTKNGAVTKSFRKCEIRTVRMTRENDGSSKVIYTFRAGALT